MEPYRSYVLQRRICWVRSLPNLPREVQSVFYPGEVGIWARETLTGRSWNWRWLGIIHMNQMEEMTGQLPMVMVEKPSHGTPDEWRVLIRVEGSETSNVRGEHGPGAPSTFVPDWHGGHDETEVYLVSYVPKNVVRRCGRMVLGVTHMQHSHCWRVGEGIQSSFCPQSQEEEAEKHPIETKSPLGTTWIALKQRFRGWTARRSIYGP